MSVFKQYSRYYNLLYQDKDYAGEVEFIDALLLKHRPESQRILDLGCGTGRHDLLLAEKGYVVHGVDSSAEMLAIAETTRAAVTCGGDRVTFHAGDVRTFRLQERFDVVLSLFHVMSYQLTNDDIAATLATSRSHLKQGGLFIFDFWYGPAVLTERPAVRVKHLEDDEIRVLRVCEPEMHPNENLVDVNYQIMINRKQDSGTEEVAETHRMRYLFMPEVDGFLKQAGFEKVFSCEWLTGRVPGFKTWGVCVGAVLV